MHSSIAFILTIVGLAAAQTPYTIDPSSVLPSTRQTWCDNQKSSCPLLCTQTGTDSLTTRANDCDPATLAFKCVCSNGLSPNASEYSQTIPYFICTEQGEQCVSKCATNDNSCQSACRSQHLCGAQNPTRVNTSTISTMAATRTGSGAASTNNDAVYTTYGGAAATDAAPASSAAAAAISFWASYGVTLLAAGLFAGFGMMI